MTCQNFTLGGRKIPPIWNWMEFHLKRTCFLLMNVYVERFYSVWTCKLILTGIFGSTWIQRVRKWLLELKPYVPQRKSTVIRSFYLSQWSQRSLWWNPLYGIEAGWRKWHHWLWHRLMTKQPEPLGGGSGWQQLLWGGLQVTKRKS